MLSLDASNGGQLFRNSLAFSALLQLPVSLSNIRATRPNPGLAPQHLTALNTLSKICSASVTGNVLSSQRITFTPADIQPARLSVNIGTAGSIPLLLQTLLLPSLLQPIELRMVGGTDVPFSPSIEYLRHVLLPALHSMKARYAVGLIAHGYYPKGNGIVSFKSYPVKFPLKPITRTEWASPSRLQLLSHSASLPKEVSRNQLNGARLKVETLGIECLEETQFKERASTIGSGIDVILSLSNGAVLGSTALGKKGKWAGDVGKEAAHEMLQCVNAKQPVDVHLADQLIPFMALAKGTSSIRCTRLTQHTLDSIMVAEAFTQTSFSVEGGEEGYAHISVKGCGFKPR